jgi:type I restriction enzyme S subunit
MHVPEGWKKGTIEDGVLLISGQHIEAKFVNEVGTGIPYLTGPADFPNGKMTSTKFTDSPKVKCKSGDFLVTVKGSGTGKVIAADKAYCISRQLMAVRAQKFNQLFTYYALINNTKRYEEAANGLIPGISRSDVLDTPLAIPPLIEQQKISQILSTWDKAIEKLEALIAAKQKRKKALMQQLLTGKIRLPWFSGEWREVSLSNLAIVTMGSSPKSGAYNENGVGLPLIQGNADIKDRLSAPRIYTTEITKECKPKDILMSVRAPVGAIAKSIHHACIGRGICAVTAKNGVDQQFLYYWLLAFESRWESLSQGSTFESVNSSDIKSITIEIPIEETEQQIIATVLSAADNEITTHQNQLAALKQQKKGLLQQLLTGKKRVKVHQVAA